MAFTTATTPLEVVFSFDTTGSMYGCLEQVRGRINDMIQRLQADIPGIRTAVIAHGDYCDAAIYITKWVDFSTNVAELCNFVSNVERTSGGDGPECYELVLNQARTQLSWTAASRRVLVLIGDDEPHGIDYHLNKDKIDWKYETKELAMMGVTIYPVQCGHGGAKATAFYKTLSTVTGGKHLKLDDFGNLFDVLMAVCYREGDDTAKLALYEKEVRAKCGSAPLANDIEAVFASLRNETDASLDSSLPATTPTIPAVKPVALLKKTSSVVKLKSPKVKRLMTAVPLKSPMRRKSAAVKQVSTKRMTAIDLYREENLSLLKRENVPNTNFRLRNLTWSSWTLIMSPELPENNTNQWVKRRNTIGYRVRNLRSTNKSQLGKERVLFEVSVRTPGSGNQRHVVYSSFSSRCFHNSQWETYLLRRVRGQLNKLMAEGCKIFMRFYTISPREDISSLRHDLGRYDYAWKAIRNVRKEARSASKGRYIISVDTC